MSIGCCTICLHLNDCSSSSHHICLSLSCFVPVIDTLWELLFVFSLSLLSFLGFSRSDLSHLTGPNSVCLLDLDMPCSAICFPRLNCFEWLISHLSSHMALKSLSISVFDIHSVLVSLHPLFLILTPLFFSVFSSQVSWTSQCGPQWSSMDPSYLLLSEWPKLFWTGLTLLPVLGVLFLSNESESCHFLKETTHR